MVWRLSLAFDDGSLTGYPLSINPYVKWFNAISGDAHRNVVDPRQMRFARDVGTKLVFMHHGKVGRSRMPII